MYSKVPTKNNPETSGLTRTEKTGYMPVFSVNWMILLFLFGGLLQTCLFLQSYHKVTQDIHVIDKCIVRGIVGTEVSVNISIREEFGTHIIEVIRSLKEIPISLDLLIIDGIHQFFQLI